MTINELETEIKRMGGGIYRLSYSIYPPFAGQYIFTLFDLPKEYEGKTEANNSRRFSAESLQEAFQMAYDWLHKPW